MSLNNTPSSERVHIGIFGKRNAGKSSLINAVTSQNLAIVSDIKGTTTDPVMKAMELLPLGPVVLIDTPGLDDSGELGLMRIQKAHQALNRCDIAVLVIDALEGITPEDGKILEKIQKKQIPCILAINKCDLLSSFDSPVPLTDSLPDSIHTIRISARNGQGIFELKEMLAASLPEEDKGRRIVGDLIHPSSLVILVIPIDKAAPKGRLILPQQQTIRDILDSGAYALTVRRTFFYWKDSRSCHYRQPGISLRRRNCSRRDFPHLFFYFICQIQRKFKNSGRRCQSFGLLKGG